MSMVTPLISSLSSEDVKKLFSQFRMMYGHLWMSRCNGREEWEECLELWLAACSKFSIQYFTLAVRDSFIQYKDFPPTLGQFVDLCYTQTGIPDDAEAFQAAIRRNFTHPVIQIAFDKIGDWAFKHDTEKDLNKKFKAAYQNAVHDYRINPAKYLPASNIKSFPVNTTAVKDTATAVSSTVPDDVKKMGFKERIAYEQAKMKKAADEANLQHPAWEKEKYTINHPNFVESVYLERRDYLMKLPEYAASTLNSADWYDRVSFLREKEAYEKEIRRNPTPDTQTYEKVSNRPYNKPRRANDYWNS